MNASLEAVAALSRFIDTAPRVGIVEPPWPQTQRFIRALIAWTYARLGAHAAASDIAAEPLHALADGDPLERFAGEVLARRLREAEEGLPCSEVPDGGSLGRDDEYLAVRMWSASLILSPRAAYDAVKLFESRQRQPRTPVMALPRQIADVADGDELIANLERELARSRIYVRPRVQPLFLAAPRFGAAVAIEMAEVVKRFSTTMLDLHCGGPWAPARVSVIDGCLFAIAEASNPLDTAPR